MRKSTREGALPRGSAALTREPKRRSPQGFARSSAVPKRFQSGREPAPPVKPTPWEWYIPIYFWLGGISAGAWLGATAEDIAGDGDRDLIRVGRYLALGGVLGGTALLIADLGRPDRFLNMLRVVRRTSAMSLGSWGLTGFGAHVGAAALLQAAEDGLLGRRPRLESWSHEWPSRALHVAGLPWALFVGGYTGVLLSGTSIPSWARRQRLLGPVFLASGISSGLAATALLLELTGRATRGSRARLARAERVALAAELALTLASRRRAAAMPSSRRASARERRMSAAMLAGGMAVPLAIRVLATDADNERDMHIDRRRRVRFRAPRPAPRDAQPASRVREVATAALVLAGGLALRFLTMREGPRSAKTPEDTWLLTRLGGDAPRARTARR